MGSQRLAGLEELINYHTNPGRVFLSPVTKKAFHMFPQNVGNPYKTSTLIMPKRNDTTFIKTNALSFLTGIM